MVIVDSYERRPMSELPEQQLALVKINVPNADNDVWMKAIKIQGKILWHDGGKPLQEEPLCWLAIHEK